MPKRKRLSAGVVVPRVLEDGTVEVLMQLKRKCGKWEFPIGKLNGRESVEECAWRELVEETDVNAFNLKFSMYVDGRDYCCMYFIAKQWNRTPKLMEPDKHSALGWFPIDKLPHPLTWFTRHAIKAEVLNSLRAHAEPV